jgi:hypothetical protein
MRAIIRYASGLLVLAMLGSPAFAQAKKNPPPKDIIRYFQFSGDLLGDLPIDAFLKETRQGNRVTAATLDVCHPISRTDSRKDRFVVTLKVEGEKLSGTGQTQEQKTPVAVNLVRRQSGNTVDFSGTITRGQAKTEVASADNTDISDEDFRAGQDGDDGIVAAPSDFTEVSPASLAMRVKREAMVGLVAELKAQRATVGLEGLIPGCVTLRSGEQIVRAELDPEKAPALVAKLKTMPGVVAAGWTSGDYAIDNAVRLPADAWLGNDRKLDRNKLGPAIADSVAKALGATVDTATWDAASGQLTLKLMRPNQMVPGVNLTDVVDLTAVVGPEKPGASTALIVWLKYAGSATVDNGPEPRLKLAGTTAIDEEGGSAVSMEDIVPLLARDLKGQHWDPGKSAWQ